MFCKHAPKISIFHQNKTRQLTVWAIAFALSIRFAFSEGSPSFDPKILLPRVQTVARTSFSFRDIETKKSTYGASLQETLLWRDFDLRYSYRIPSTAFNIGFKKEYGDTDRITVLGAALRFNKMIKVPLTLMAGKLSIKGSAEKITHPYCATTLRYFGTAIPLTSGITATLPTTTAESTPASFVAIYDTDDIPKNIRPTGSIVKHFDCAFMANENTDVMTSGNLIFKLGEKGGFLTFSQTLLAARTSYSSSSWWTPVPQFPATQYFYSSTQLAYRISHLQARFIFNLYDIGGQNDRIAKTFNCEVHVPFKYFGFTAAGFYSSNYYVILPNDKLLLVLSQGKFAPYFIIPIKDAQIRLGGGYYIEERLNSSREYFINQKYGGGILAKSPLFFAQATFTADDKEGKDTRYTIYTRYEPKITLHPTFTATFSWYDDISSQNSLSLRNTLYLPRNDKTYSIALKENVTIIAGEKYNYTQLGFGFYICNKTKYSITSFTLNIKVKCGN